VGDGTDAFSAASALVSAALTAREQSRMSGDPSVGVRSFEATIQGSFGTLLDPNGQLNLSKLRMLVEVLAYLGAMGFEASASQRGISPTAELSTHAAGFLAELKKLGLD
jgi:hypothetical protein